MVIGGESLGPGVAVLVGGVQDAGDDEVKFDAMDLPSGVCFYRLEAGSYTETKTLILIRWRSGGKSHREHKSPSRELIIEGVKEVVAPALERHKKLGEPAAVWTAGNVVMLKPSQIPSRSCRPGK